MSTTRSLPAAIRMDRDAAGIGLKPIHANDILRGGERASDFFEVHAENYMGAGGPPHRLLETIRRDYPISVHGVGLSIGGAGPLDEAHLERLRILLDRYEPALFSEHLAWSTHEGVFFNDLLPLPYNEESLDLVADHIDRVQETLGRRMLLENPSSYLQFGNSDMGETDFLAAVSGRTGCGLLLDVNNVFVSAVNHGFDAAAYIDRFPLQRVGEVHLAGYLADVGADGAPLLIDAHDSPVDAAVWGLYRQVLRHVGPVPTLIEWDNDVPEFRIVAAEAARARAALRLASLPQHHDLAA